MVIKYSVDFQRYSLLKILNHTGCFKRVGKKDFKLISFLRQNRSFWLSVDPLADITVYPYSYVWNDPVNFADPTGMMGERKGGNDRCEPPSKRSFVRRVWDWLFKHKSQGNIAVGPVESVPTFSPAPDERMPSTIGSAIQDYRDSGPTPIYGAMGVSILTKGITDGALDFGNFLRNSFFNKSDYSGLGPRMTKWDGNTMGGEESQNAKFNAILFADGLMTAGVGLTTQTTTSVYRVQRTGQFLELDDANNVIYNSMNGKPKTIYMFVGDETSALNYAKNKPGSTITKFEINSKYANKILEIKHPQELGLKSISASDANVVGGYNRIGVHSNKIKGFLKWQKPGSGKIIKPK
ncbi:MAG TPA: hypothetical protein DEB71_14335 [Chryseobacterium carnipullorum]|nr:hypothetical protein [Chryseobacterium carnipullorum]